MGVFGAFLFLIGAMCLVAGAWIFGVPLCVLGAYVAWWDNKHNEPKRKAQKRQKKLDKEMNTPVMCDRCGWKGMYWKVQDYDGCCPSCSNMSFRRLK